MMCFTIMRIISTRQIRALVVLLTIGVQLMGCVDASDSSTTPSSGASPNSSVWQGAELIESDVALDNRSPNVAIAPNGDAIAVWTHWNGSTWDAMSNRYVSGQGWEGEKLLETDDSGDVRFIDIAMDSSGNAIAIWNQSFGAQYDMMANRYVIGSGWQGAVAIETSDLGDADEARIAYDLNDNAIVVWKHFDGSFNSVMANWYLVDKGWQKEALIETTAGNINNPLIEFDASGNAMATWVVLSAGIWRVQANYYDHLLGWQGEDVIESVAKGALRGDVAFDHLGNAMVVMNIGVGVNVSNIYANRYVPGKGWDGETPIEQDDTGNAFAPKIAFDKKGNAVAVWYQNDGSRDNIVSNRYDVDSGWQSVELVETDNTGMARSPDIAFDGAGDFVAVWRQQDSANISAMANKYVTGTGWQTPEFLENSDTEYVNIAPLIAMNATGRAVAVWESIEAGKYHINSNLYR